MSQKPTQDRALIRRGAPNWCRKRAADQHKIVMQASPVDEGILVVADEGVEPWRETELEHLGENLDNKVYEADRPIIAQAAGVCALGKQQEQRLVQVQEPTSA